MKLYGTVALSLVAALAASQVLENTRTMEGNSASGRQMLPGREAGGGGQGRRAREAQQVRDAEVRGVEVRIKDIARFRGVRSNQLLGYGLVVGLDRTGDTRNTPFTATLLANAMRNAGTAVDPAALRVQNVAVVAITAELPPFASPGNRIDVTVQSIGDAKSLQGGYLLQAPLYSAAGREVVYAAAQGSVSIGGFSAGGGGSSQTKNHATVGRIPEGATVETPVPTKVLFDGKMFLELDDADATTAQRMVEALSKQFPEFLPTPVTPGTIQLTLPEGRGPLAAMRDIESATVFADVPAVVVINERTGTIVVGGNVRLGPALVAKGSLQVRIETEPIISQPEPLSQGQTVVTEQTKVDAAEEIAQVALLAPTTTVSDLARIFQTLKLSPSDIISILQALQEQGALKARIRIQ